MKTVFLICEPSVMLGAQEGVVIVDGAIYITTKELLKTLPAEFQEQNWEEIFREDLEGYDKEFAPELITFLNNNQ